LSKKAPALPGGRALDLERRLSYRFSIFAAKIIRGVAGMYGPKYGLLPSGWKTMAAIGRYQPVSAKQVCAYTTIEPDKVSRAVDRLVELGFVNRTQDTKDRRRVVLTLSPAGRRAYKDIEHATRTVEMALLDCLSSGERSTLDRILAKLEVRMAQYLDNRH
jgi:DNA-binding MarR family transcriptional regulator